MEDMEKIGRDLFQKVARRLAEEVARDSADKGITTGNTERYDRVFALWVNLQKAIQHEWGNETRECTQWPWKCEDTRIRRAWEALTHPRNELALEILSHQLPEGSQVEIIRKALQVSRDRKLESVRSDTAS